MEAAIIGNISNIELVFRTCQNSKFNNAENKPIKKGSWKEIENYQKRKYKYL